MRSLTLLALVAAVGPASAPRPPVMIPPPAEERVSPVPIRTTYRVKQQGGGLGIFVDEAVVFHEVGQGAKRVWLVERRRRDDQLGQVTFRYEWIDGRTCPALEEVVSRIGAIPPASIAGPSAPPRGWVSDTPEVTLMGPTADGLLGDVMLLRDLNGPVSHWWRASQKALATCWKSQQPYVENAYLRPRLATAQDEVEVMRP